MVSNHKKTRKALRPGKKKTRRRITKLNKRKQRGGKIYGEGTYGTVYGDPHIPCKGETIGDVVATRDTEVSKYFYSRGEAEKEGAIRTYLERNLGDDFAEFENYAVVPKRICDLDIELMQANTDVYNTKWYEGDPILAYDGMGSSRIVISDRGIHDLFEDFKFVKPMELGGPDGFQAYVRRMMNIGKGVELLQKHNMIHGDLKSLNAVALMRDGRKIYKIIDVGDIRKINGNWSQDDAELLAAPIMYPYRPSIAFYYMFNSVPESAFESIFGRIQFKPESLVGTVYKFAEFNVNTSRFVDTIFTEAFNIKEGNGFSREEMNFIKTIKATLYGQKLFNYKTDLKNPLESELVKEESNYATRFALRLQAAIRNPDYIAIIENVKTTIDYYNSICNMFTTKESLVSDLFKRCDSYSFGIMLLEMMKTAVSYTDNTDVFPNQLKNMFLYMYAIVFECCYQGYTAPDMDAIMKKYQDILDGNDVVFDLKYFDGDRMVSINIPERIQGSTSAGVVDEIGGEEPGAGRPESAEAEIRPMGIRGRQRRAVNTLPFGELSGGYTFRKHRRSKAKKSRRKRTSKRRHKNSRRSRKSHK